jgi:hypothetical protein
MTSTNPDGLVGVFQADVSQLSTTFDAAALTAGDIFILP